MPDTTTVVKTLDIQMLDADRQDATLIKLDNPKDNITREMVSAAMQPAFANSWFLTTKGSIAMYLGDVTISTSTKVKLDGQDFYVTPSSINEGVSGPIGELHPTINVSGATIQGYQYTDVDSNMAPSMGSPTPTSFKVTPSIINNGLTFKLDIIFAASNVNHGYWSCNVVLVIQGTQVTVPVRYYILV